MKRIMIIVVLSIMAIAGVTAQNVVHLKNGSILRGELIEYIPNEKVSVKMSDGSVFVYSPDEVASIAKDDEKQARVTNVVYYDERYSAPRGYRGFVDVTPFDVTSQGLALSVNTTHGYQFNHNIFVGGGMGLTVDYLNGYYAIPIYASLKGNVGRGAVQFTYGVNMGVGIGKGEFTVSYFDPGAGYYNEEYCILVGSSFYSNYGIGMRFGVNPDFAVKLVSELDVYIGPYFGVGWGIGVGFEF